VLALSNEPQLLIEMVLDMLLHLLKVDYGWVQLIDSEDRNLRLIASRSSTPETARVVGLTDSQRILGERVVVGLEVVIPDLSRNGKDGLVSFSLAGLRSLAAVPIRTYHTQGVIGVASRTKKRLDNDVAELLMTVAGLVGATLNVADLGRIALNRERQRFIEKPSKVTPVSVEDIPRSALTTRSELPIAKGSVSADPPDTGVKKVKPTEGKVDNDGTFEHHSRSMSDFRRTHEKG
jgi:transcriptional regulator with GAF, ATPase, and Fis domain